MSKALNLAIGARNPTEVTGVYSVTGAVRKTREGWFRRDSVVIGDQEIGGRPGLSPFR